MGERSSYLCLLLYKRGLFEKQVQFFYIFEIVNQSMSLQGHFIKVFKNDVLNFPNLKNLDFTKKLIKSDLVNFWP